MFIKSSWRKKKPEVKTLILLDAFALENSFHLQTH